MNGEERWETEMTRKTQQDCQAVQRLIGGLWLLIQSESSQYSCVFLKSHATPWAEKRTKH